MVGFFALQRRKGQEIKMGKITVEEMIIYSGILSGAVIMFIWVYYSVFVYGISY